MCDRNCRKKFYRPVTHVIFDLDGTILDSEEIYGAIFTEMLRERGYAYTKELRRKVLGRTTEQCWQLLLQEFKLAESLTNIVAEFRTRAHDRLGNCQFMPGVEKVAYHLYKKKVPIGIATSSAKQMYLRKIEPHQKFFEMFDPVVCGGSDPDVKEGKPNPTIFIVCAQRFADNPCPEHCLVFEDAPNGVIAATKAGMQCIAIPDPDMPRDAFKDATLILNSMDEFIPENFGLPCYYS